MHERIRATVSSRVAPQEEYILSQQFRDRILFCPREVKDENKQTMASFLKTDRQETKTDKEERKTKK